MFPRNLNLEFKSRIRIISTYLTISILLVLGVFLIVCLLRYPSYTTEENLRRDRRLRKGNRSGSSTTVLSIQVKSLPSDDILMQYLLDTID